MVHTTANAGLHRGSTYTDRLLCHAALDYNWFAWDDINGCYLEIQTFHPVGG
jgi:hypothetical protein